MYHYSVNTDIRTTTYGVLGIAGAAVASGFTLFASQLPLTVAAPSGLVAFGVLVWIFDRFAWRWSWINAAIGIPVLDGYWEGELIRNLVGGAAPEKRIVKMTVTQRWTTMNIVFSGQSSTSTAGVIAIYVSDPKNISMRWMYDAKDNSADPAKNRYVEGTTQLTLSEVNGVRRLVGTYYSAKLSKGTIILTEVAK